MLRKLNSFFSKETNFILICVFLISFLSLIPLLANRFIHTPKDTLYTFVHNYVPDFYQYVSWMKDGADGKPLIASRLSPDLFVRKPVYLFYPLSGFVISKLGINLFFGYTLLRVMLGLINLLLIYIFISQIFKEGRLRKIAFLFALFLPPFYRLKPLSLLLPYITSIDPLQRVLFLPHDLAATSLFLLAMIFFSQKKFLFSGVFLFLASIINPAMIILLLIFFGVAAALQAPLPFFLVVVPTLAVIAYYQHLFATTLPFSWMYQQQKVNTLMLSFKDFVLLAGPALFLAVFSFKDFLKSKQFINKLVACWAVFPFVLFPFLGKYLPISRERIFETSFYIPLAILAGMTISKLAKKINFAIIFAGIILFILPYLYTSLKWQIELFKSPYFNVYVPKTLVETMLWLDKNTPDESVVLAGYYTGNMVPAFSHNRVVFGHDFATYQARDRLKDMAMVYSKDTSSEQLKEILARNHVSYIFFSPETPTFSQTNLNQLDNLRLLFSDSGIVIYQMNL